DQPDAGDLSERRAVPVGDRGAPPGAEPQGRRDRSRLSTLRHSSCGAAAAGDGRRGPRVSTRTSRGLFVVAAAIALTVPRAGAQESFSTGQNIAPVYEGWEQNTDGSFNLVFGYMNRNWDEEIDVPLGADNTIEPGGPDRGQPTHFLPRRNRFL